MRVKDLRDGSPPCNTTVVLIILPRLINQAIWMGTDRLKTVYRTRLIKIAARFAIFNVTFGDTLHARGPMNYL